jgi:hypothetical protein
MQEKLKIMKLYIKQNYAFYIYGILAGTIKNEPKIQENLK